MGFFIFSALSPNCYPFYVVIGTLFYALRVSYLEMKSILHRRTNKSHVLLNHTHGFALPVSGALPGP